MNFRKNCSEINGLAFKILKICEDVDKYETNRYQLESFAKSILEKSHEILKEKILEIKEVKNEMP